MTSLEEFIDSYDMEVLASQLQGDSIQSSIISLKEQDVELTRQLQVCNHLSSFYQLFNDLTFDENPSVVQIQHLVESFNKLAYQRHRLDEFLAKHGVDLSKLLIVQDISQQTEAKKQQLTNQLMECLKLYIKIEDSKIEFHSTVDGLSFHKFCSLDDSLNSRRFHRVFEDWLKEHVNQGLSYFQNTLTVSNAEQSFINVIESLESFVRFINDFEEDNTSKSFNLKHYTSKTLYDILKPYMLHPEIVFDLLQSKICNIENKTMSRLIELNRLLVTTDWVKNLSDIDIWLDDLVSQWLDTSVESLIEELKYLSQKILTNQSWTETIQEVNKLEAEKWQFERRSSTKNPQMTSTKNTETEWDNWDDGWDSESVNDKRSVDARSIRSKRNSWGDNWDRLSKKDSWSDNGWNDGWNEEFSDNDNDVTETRSNIRADEPEMRTSNTHSYTLRSSVSEQFLQVIKQKFFNPVSQVSSMDIDPDVKDEIKDLRSSKSIVIINSIVMLFDSFLTPRYATPILVYQDLSYLINQIDPQKNSLADNFLSNLIDSESDFLFQSALQYNDLFVDNDDSSDRLIELASQFQLDFQKKASQFYEKFYYNSNNFTVNETLNITLILTILDQFLQSLSDLILERESIGDEESKILANVLIVTLQSLLPSKYHGTTDPLAVKIPQTIKHYHKIQSIAFMFQSSMKVILDEFYEGSLYDMETNELIRLIKALFIDSEMRSATINEIVDVRTTD
ncbi:hypothetical protein LJB42_000659 [Komagataella kurtzmanii]|nr:hypothetical protein LJB42_000659 [Komagataella kurtzmanii]